MYKSNISVDRIAETADATICVGRELLRSVQAFARGLERRLSEIECFIEYASCEEGSCELLEQLGVTKYEHYVRSSIENIYLTATRLMSGELAEIGERQLDSAEQFNIRAQMIDNSIVVRLPMLWSMYRRRSDGSRPYGHMFAAEVESVVRELITTLDQEVIEKFQKKTLIYCFVYSQEDRYVLDSDNHDSKTITDAVCAPFLSTDSGCSTLFCYRTIITDSLQPGTYIVLSPGMGSIPNLDVLSSFRAEVDENDDCTKDPICAGN